MKKNWEVVIDEKTAKLLVDEETEHNCWSFWTCRPEGSGYGAVATKRELCFKKIIRKYKKEFQEKERELNKIKRNLKKLEEKYEIK